MVHTWCHIPNECHLNRIQALITQFMQNNIALHYNLAETLNMNGRKHPLIANDTEALLLIFLQKAVGSNSITHEGTKQITFVTMYCRGYVKT